MSWGQHQPLSDRAAFSWPGLAVRVILGGDGVRFLVVEDEEIAARAMRALLSPYGEIVLAQTARDAQRALGADGGWSAFFIDVSLPDGSGLDFLAHARVDFPTTPAMVLTGCLDAGAINATFDLGADYVAKPVHKARITRFLMARPEFSLRLQRVVELWRKRYGLSEAEADVLRRSAAGETREGIADARRCSRLTVKAHVANILAKTADETLFAAVGRVLRIVAGEC
jgi:two-component system response regulator DevR